MKFKGREIVSALTRAGVYEYQVIKGVMEYECGDCVVVSHMDPDYIMLFGRVNLVISEKGSPLSHLAIIAREYGKTVILVEDIMSKISAKGRLIIIDNQGEIEIEIQ